MFFCKTKNFIFLGRIHVYIEDTRTSIEDTRIYRGYNTITFIIYRTRIGTHYYPQTQIDTHLLPLIPTDTPFFKIYKFLVTYFSILHAKN